MINCVSLVLSLLLWLNWNVLIQFFTIQFQNFIPFFPPVYANLYVFKLELTDWLFVVISSDSIRKSNPPRTCNASTKQFIWNWNKDKLHHLWNKEDGMEGIGTLLTQTCVLGINNHSECAEARKSLKLTPSWAGGDIFRSATAGAEGQTACVEMSFWVLFLEETHPWWCRWA